MKSTNLILLTSACLVLSTSAELVPGGDFQLYKPGEPTVTATLTGGWVPWGGVTSPTDLAISGGGTADYSDGTSGDTVDLLGWVKIQGNADILANGPDGSLAFNAFASWGGQTRIESAEPLGTVQSGDVITISVMVGGPDSGPIQGPLAFHLVADGVELTPTSSVDPTLPNNGEFQEISRTYEGDAIADHIGASLTIILGVEVDNTIGNRVIYDNVSIEGITSESTRIPLIITPTAGSPGNYDFEWGSQTGKQYDLITSTDLATPMAEWPVYDDGAFLYENLPATGATTTLSGVPSSDPRRFFAIREEDVPPPPPLLSMDFEDDDGGFTTTKTAGTGWEWGEPNSTGEGGTVDAGNSGSAKCWGTDIGNPGFYDEATTESCLLSPVIDLTSIAGAELSFAQAIDFPAGDQAVIRIYSDPETEIVNETFPFVITDDDVQSANWHTIGPITLPVGTPIQIKWCFTGSGGTTNDYMGWYIDDVVVVETAP